MEDATGGLRCSGHKRSRSPASATGAPDSPHHGQAMRHEPVESRMLGDGHVRLGGRVEETDRVKPRTPRLDPTPNTKLKGPAKWTWYYLFVILDIYSRYVVGWTVQH